MTERHQALQLLLRRLRRQAWLTVLLQAAAVAAVASGVVMLTTGAVNRSLWTALVFGLVSLGLLRGGRAFHRLDPGYLAQHLDRVYPQLEESTSLLLRGADGLSPAQAMQQRRAAAAFDRLDWADRAWRPSRPRAWPAMALLAGLLLWAAADPLRSAWQFQAQRPLTPTATPAAAETTRLLEVSVQVAPPAYTGLPVSEWTELDLELPEGSQVTWQLRLSTPGPFALSLGDEQSLPLERTESGAWTASAVVHRTDLYRLVAMDASGPRPVGGIHTLSVRLDSAPTLRILAPGATVLEIPRDGPPTFDSEVLVQDDHGVDRVEIRASVGKGGGEGVKFRDEVFAFDSVDITDDGSIYRRFWDLLSLQMEPGDEVYFFALATDRRTPEPNLGRSETVTVRWLDDAAPMTVAEGFGIDVMPDYFKSQRQIIIETEQLIADRDGLSTAEFDDTSRALAMAQADLKQRYGQFLGDEFGEGEGAEFIEEPEEPEDHEDDALDEVPNDGDDALAGVGHDHGDESPAAIDTSGGADELIARFAHDHGAAEIGPITARNPVGLMKRSISNMWQAELHLHLSEPELALPFEYEALKYLNLARQAERIYTRRLGFEPPPVSEERRLTGELDEILDVRRQIEGVNEQGDNELFRRLATRLSGNRLALLNNDDRDLLSQARQRLTELAQQRPALIRQAATLESLIQGGPGALDACPDCLAQLRQAAWSLAARPDAAPRRGHARPALDDDLAEAFRRALGQEGSP